MPDLGNSSNPAGFEIRCTPGKDERQGDALRAAALTFLLAAILWADWWLSSFSNPIIDNS